MKTITMLKLSLIASATILVAACNEDAKEAPAATAVALNFEDVKIKESYTIGIGAGKSMKANVESIDGTGIELDLDVVIQAFNDGLKGDSQLDEAAITETMNAFRVRVNDAMQAQRAAEAEEQKIAAEENVAKGAEFLAANKVKDGVIVTESGLQYKILKAGTGKSPLATDTVKVHYTGTLIDGTKFDSSRDRGEPATFGVSRVIKGWTEGLQLMKVGSQWEFYIPSDIAYGASGNPKIPGNSVLVFDVELIEVIEIPKPAK
ncbi:MAG: FKBP-type peptidyl-prolyl cis-trans isomerase FkpA [Flavobacteriales bacterium]|jgi:FKBP-type peptidyl-prolyl cis-trans isomerase FkpA